MPTFHELIDDAHAHGFLLNNLFEIDPAGGNGGWQANFRRPSGGQAFGYGATPEEALASALAKAVATLKPPAPNPKQPDLFEPSRGLFD